MTVNLNFYLKTNYKFEVQSSERYTQYTNAYNMYTFRPGKLKNQTSQGFGKQNLKDSTI